MAVELINGRESQEFWVVRVLNEDDTHGPEGFVPSTYLEIAPVQPDTAVKARSASILQQKSEKGTELESMKHRE